MHSLRQYQVNCLNNLRTAIAQSFKTPLLMLPTGAGKTVIASHLIKSANQKGNRCLFIVDSLELVDQTAERFMRDGLDVSVIQGNHPLTNYMKLCQVATIQTLRVRWEKLLSEGQPQVVIIDECHVFHSTHRQIIEDCRARGIIVIGLSATPWRKGLGLHFDHLIVGVTNRELIDQGYLSKSVIYAPHIPDLSRVPTNGADGDWVETALSEVMGDAQLVGDVVDQWMQHCVNRQTLVFACNVQHSKDLAAAFQARGVRAEHVDGYARSREAREERARLIRAYRSGEIQVLCNAALLTKGFDAPETSALVIARPTKSRMLHFQMLGRGLRIAPGKHNLIILDHSGNCWRLGKPTASIPTSLNTGKPDEPSLDRPARDLNEPVERPCPVCHRLSSRRICPSCSHEKFIPSGVIVRDGRLYEMPEQETAKPEDPWPPARLAQFYAECLGYCQAYDKKAGYAYHLCQQYSGKAPVGLSGVTPAHPSEQTLRIIKHLQIRRAKGRAKYGHIHADRAGGQA